MATHPDRRDTVTTALNQQRIEHLEGSAAYEIPDAPSQDVEPGRNLAALVDKNRIPGKTFVLEDGEYTMGRITQSVGCLIMARNERKAIIRGGSGDTISMMDGARLEETTFRGLVIEGSGRSAVMTLSDKPPYRFNFEDCTIDGLYDHAARSGRDTKWGLMIHRWAGYAARCLFENIKREHAAYIHTPMSDILLYKNTVRRCGRTAFQFVGRNNEAGYADVEVHVHGGKYEDCGLKDGGSTLTVQGIGTLLVDGNAEFLIGTNRAFRDAYMASHPDMRVFSTGHIVNWSDKGRCDPTRLVTLKDVNIFSHPGDGNAPCVQVKNADGLSIQGKASIQAGFNRHAFELKYGMNIDLSKLVEHKLDGEVVLA
jgi:hypothetical protein